MAAGKLTSRFGDGNSSVGGSWDRGPFGAATSGFSPGPRFCCFRRHHTHDWEWFDMYFIDVLNAFSDIWNISMRFSVTIFLYFLRKFSLGSRWLQDIIGSNGDLSSAMQQTINCSNILVEYVSHKAEKPKMINILTSYSMCTEVCYFITCK